MGRLRGVVALVLVALLAVLAGCGGKPVAPAAGPGPTPPKKDVPGITKDSITIGSWGPLTGPAAAFGDPLIGAKAYFDYINEQGGINGRKFKWVGVDDQYQPSKTVGVAKQLVESDKVFAVQSVIGTSPIATVWDYMLKNQVPIIALNSGADRFVNPLQRYAFQGLISYGTEGRILVQYANDTLKLKKYGIFYQNDDFGKGGLEGAKEQIAKVGGTVVKEVAHLPADTDQSAAAQAFKDAGAEAVLIWGTVQNGVLLYKAAANVGYKPKFMLSSVAANTQLNKLSGGTAEGAYTVAYSADFFDLSNPVVADFHKLAPKYIGKADKDLAQGMLTGWNQARIVAEAIKRCGDDVTREKFIDTLEHMGDYPSLAKIAWSPQDHRVATAGWVNQLKGEKWEKISDVVQPK